MQLEIKLKCFVPQLDRIMYIFSLEGHTLLNGNIK